MGWILRPGVFPVLGFFVSGNGFYVPRQYSANPQGNLSSCGNHFSVDKNHTNPFRTQRQWNYKIPRSISKAVYAYPVQFNEIWVIRCGDALLSFLQVLDSREGKNTLHNVQQTILGKHAELSHNCLCTVCVSLTYDYCCFSVGQYSPAHVQTNHWIVEQFRSMEIKTNSGMFI